MNNALAGRLLVVLLPLLIVGGASPPARAQHSTMSTSIFNDATTFSPELSRADLEVFRRVLSLAPAEADAMEELHTAYANTLKTEGFEVRRFVAVVMEEAEALADMKLLAPAHDKLEAWTKRADELKKTFMDDLKSLLTRDQEARWPIVERELRRMKLLGSGRVPGEQVDLVELVEALPAATKGTPAISDLLERYSQDMDRAITSRTAFFDKNNTEFDGLITSDPVAAKRMYELATREREGVANVNERYLREIASHLEPSVALDLRDRYFRLSYPLLAKGTRGERYILAAGKLTDLTSEQRAQLDIILGEYDKDRRAIVDRMADVVRERKLTMLPERLEEALNPPPPPTPGSENERVWGSAGKVLAPDHPLSKLRRTRFELDRACRAKVDAVLTPEQREKLPDLALEAVTFYDDDPWGL